ncbi:MAG: prephenate dehydratase [Treponema sp.]|nr:prephenate dehydratase [Treponema sp.]
MTPSTTETIAFCGEHGAFAELALFRAFGEDAAALPAATFAAVFDAVRDGSAAFGVVPVENSLAGSVHENYDLFLRYPDIAIVGEIKIRIVHNLIVHPDAGWDTIKTVRSHPQGLAQCKAFLDQHPGWQLEAWNNTAMAVVSIVKEKKDPLTIAAIASGAAAKLNGLKILKAGIETNIANYTRFVIISRRQGEEAPYPSYLAGKPNNKASVVFATKDEPGSLYVCLQILADRNINLSKIESRPIHGQPWHYMFYLDVNVPPDQGAFEAALHALKKRTEDFHFLGSYRAALQDPAAPI